MIWQAEFLLFTTLLFILLFSGQWIAFALGTTGIIGLYLTGNSLVFKSIGHIAWHTTNSFELTALPLFVFMGEIILKTGLSGRFYFGANKWFGHIPGGLLHSNIVSCAFFAAISGSSVATASAIGAFAYPELEKRGFDRRMVFGSLAAGGSLGLLIPPSIPLIVYGAMVEESVAKLFAAAMMPGIMMAVIFSIYIAIRCILNKQLSPKFIEIVPWKDKIRSFKDMAPFFIMITIILGGIYSGYTTATEAAALGVIVALTISAIYGKFKIKYIRDSLVSTVRVSCMVIFIMISAQVLSFMFVKSGINRALTSSVKLLNPDVMTFMIIIIILFLILGCLVDGLSMMFLTLPILYPIVKELGISGLLFGVVMVILIELGQITPPVGLNLFVLQGVSGGRPLREVIEGSVPYFFLMLFGVMVVLMFPGLVFWLPSMMVNR